MEHATETAVEVVVMLLCASAMLTVFYYLFTSVMAMLSLAMYTDVISRLLERLF